MNWYAKINAVDNGFIVDYFDGETKKKVVYQLKTDGDDLSSTETDKEHIVEMFYELLQFFGEQGSKHDKKRLHITYDKQQEV